MYFALIQLYFKPLAKKQSSATRPCFDSILQMNTSVEGKWLFIGVFLQNNNLNNINIKLL